MQDVAQQAGQHTFNSRDFRNALGSFATGVTVITTYGDGEPYGLTANAFTSVSLDPPLVLICVISGSQGSEAIQRNGVFAVNVLGAEQEPLSRYFASRERPRGVEGFSQVPHRQGVTGSPILEGVAAHLDCRLVASRDAGDHVVFVGEVLALDSAPDVQPLTFHAGRYRHLSEE